MIFSSHKKPDYMKEVAFEYFDKHDAEQEKGKISKTILLRAMTTLGEVCTLEEVEQMLNEANQESAKYIDYTKFLDKLMPEQSPARQKK